MHTHYVYDIEIGKKRKRQQLICTAEGAEVAVVLVLLVPSLGNANVSASFDFANVLKLSRSSLCCMAKFVNSSKSAPT